MRSVFVSRGNFQDGKLALKTHTVPEFSELARRFVQQLRNDLNANEVRALAANKVASPVLQVGFQVNSELSRDLPTPRC